MRRVLTWTLLVSLLAGASALGVALAQVWTDTQTTSGAVNVTAQSAELHICELALGGDVPCPNDDSGPDELIFEGIENMGPGQTRQQDVLLQNVSTVAWDVTGADVSVTETRDPGADCTDEPTVQMYNTDPDGYDHGGSGLLFPTLGNPAQQLAIHAEPGGYDGIRIVVSLASTLPVECQDNEWDIAIAWTVSPH